MQQGAHLGIWATFQQMQLKSFPNKINVHFLKSQTAFRNLEHYLLSAHLIPFTSLVFTSIYIVLKVQ